MAKLTTAKRNKLRRSQFAEPEKRKYPIEDISHARNALSRVSTFGTPREKSLVRTAVHKRYPQINCVSCHVNPATHMHGSHGCCGILMCHYNIIVGHIVAGEGGL